MENKKYFIITYGCQMNVHESEKLAGMMRALGYTSADSEAAADVIIFNTCCIRKNAEDRAKGNIGALKKLKKQNKNLIIAVGGCMTQQPGEAAKLKKTFPFIDIIFGTHNLENFKELLTEKLKTKKSVIAVEEKEGEIKEGTEKYRTGYPNAWVNIMYGCNNFCTYCIVPYVRGRERSRKSAEIIKECKSLIAEGYKEITLLGQNVNSYGNDRDGEINFSQLLEKIAVLDGDFRLRFMTNHPKDFSEELIDVIASYPKICKSVHLPIQSGSERILRLMNRHYSGAEYLEKIRKLKRKLPDCAVTTDIMVGFPTETDEDFNDTLNIVKSVRFTGAFTFVYSPRTGTKAAEMDGQIDEATSKKRIMRLIDTQNEINREQSEAYIGKTVKILAETFDGKKNMYCGRDEYGKMAYFKATDNPIGKFVDIKITEANGISLTGICNGGI